MITHLVRVRAERARLAAEVRAALTAAIPDSRAELRGSLASGTADSYSGIDRAWVVPDDMFAAAVESAATAVESLGALSSLRRDPGLALAPGSVQQNWERSSASLNEVTWCDVQADRLRLEVKCAAELVAGVCGVVPEHSPVAIAASIPVAAARLDVVFTHEANDVAYLDDQVTAVVADASDGRDSVPRTFDLWPVKPLLVMEELHPVRRCRDE